VTRRYGPLPPAVLRPRTRARAALAIGLAAVALTIGAFAWPRAGAAVTPPVAVVAADGEVRVMVDGVEHRYRVGQPGDIVLLGRWTCEGAPALGLYRPSTGRVLEFDAAGGAPIATAELRPAASPVVTRAHAGCDAITLAPP
ncbi:MAG: hypothetical protein QOE63_2087, partial [Acidimicrobiaceae bacterium]